MKNLKRGSLNYPKENVYCCVFSCVHVSRSTLLSIGKGPISGIRACFVFDSDHFVVSKTLYFSPSLLSAFFMNQQLSRIIDERSFFRINDHRDLSIKYFFSLFWSGPLCGIKNQNFLFTIFYSGLLIKFNIFSFVWIDICNSSIVFQFFKKKKDFIFLFQSKAERFFLKKKFRKKQKKKTYCW